MFDVLVLDNLSNKNGIRFLSKRHFTLTNTKSPVFFDSKTIKGESQYQLKILARTFVIKELLKTHRISWFMIIYSFPR